MQNTPPEQAPPKQPQVIKPVCVNDAGRMPAADLEGYAVHTGKARSTEDVTVRRGTAPILVRGDGGDDEDAADPLDDVNLASGGAPD
jgi:hypothetical protein